MSTKRNVTVAESVTDNTACSMENTGLRRPSNREYGKGNQIFDLVKRFRSFRRTPCQFLNGSLSPPGADEHLLLEYRKSRFGSYGIPVKSDTLENVFLPSKPVNYNPRLPDNSKVSYII